MLWKWERRDPYGNNVVQGTIEFNLRFAGQYYDVESGLNYNINRMYDANTKRYMQSDPMGLIAGWNTYNYVGRNPLNYIDPLGLNGNNVMIVNFYPNFNTQSPRFPSLFPDNSLVIVAEGVDDNLSNKKGEVFGLLKESANNFPELVNEKNLAKTSHGEFYEFGVNDMINVLNKYYPNHKNYKNIYLFVCNAGKHKYMLNNNLTLSQALKEKISKDINLYASEYYIKIYTTPGIGILGGIKLKVSNDDENYRSVDFSEIFKKQ